ncbi:MAG TPA: hypothetical protein VNA16_06180 [Abditibacteriaceae bacterium]|nr:hypothetical protein [Abditibacteriaceae bacterium]
MKEPTLGQVTESQVEGRAPDEEGAAVAVPQPTWMVVYHSAAFAFSALLSPYLVIPAGTVAIVASQSSTHQQFMRWTSWSVFFSTVVPALYVVVQMLRGKITDVHVMEREQRGGPFLTAIISSAVGAGVLHQLDAPVRVWGIGVVLAVNGLIMLWVSSFWKISIHVAVLSATVLAAIVMIQGVSVWSLVWLVPALIWARVTRGRHSLLQGVAACVTACVLTGGVMYAINLGPRAMHVLHSIF